MTSSSAFNPSESVKFIVKNNSSIKRSIKIFNQSIPYNTSVDLMDIPGVTEEDIRSELTKGTLKNLITGGSLVIVSSTVNLTSLDASFNNFLTTNDIANTLTNPDYLTQAVWYIDPTSGVDSNDGLTSATALKTFTELSRRWGLGNVLSPPGANNGTSTPAPVTINILGSLPDTDVVNFDVVLDGNVYLVFLGGVTSSTALTVSSVTVKNRTTNVPWQFATGGGLSVGQRIFNSTSNTYMWAVKDLGSNSFRISEPLTIPSTNGTLLGTRVTPLITDTYAIETLFNLKLGSIKVSSVRATTGTLRNLISFRNFNFTGDFCFDSHPLVSWFCYGCKFTRGVHIISGRERFFINCLQSGGNQLFRVLGGFGGLQGGAYIGSTAFELTNTSFVLNQDVILQGLPLTSIGGNRLTLGTVGIFDSVIGGPGNTNFNGAGVMISGGGSVELRDLGDGAHALWGSGQAGPGIAVSGGSTFCYQTTPPTITGSSPGTNDFMLGGQTSSYGPTADGYFIGPTTNSWANFNAPLGAGTGFAGNAANPQRNAWLVKLH